MIARKLGIQIFHKITIITRFPDGTEKFINIMGEEETRFSDGTV